MCLMPETEEATLVHSGEQVCTCSPFNIDQGAGAKKCVLWAGNKLVTRYT
jgi:hypothetical protein